jgi:hypothetical protein
MAGLAADIDRRLLAEAEGLPTAPAVVHFRDMHGNLWLCIWLGRQGVLSLREMYIAPCQPNQTKIVELLPRLLAHAGQIALAMQAYHKAGFLLRCSRTE